ncbi:MAG: tripartite tricarboxylate transporter TctB family protein [Cypionkella sp.]|nr:tripartite tricarboxylate transporter TctB family protein [Cypionkella sp.]
MRPIEAIPAAFLLLVAALVFLGTSGLSLWDGPTPGPRFFPVILSITGTIIALVLLFAQLRGLESVVTDFPNRHGAIRVMGIVVALVLMALGVKLIGFVPALALFVTAVLWGLLRQSLPSSALTAAVVAGFVHFVFVRWLSVPLPMPFGI